MFKHIMLQLVTAMVLIILTISCGTAVVSTGEPELTCAQEEQNGVYIMSLSTIASTCGNFPLMEVEVEDGVIYPTEDAECTLASSGWSGLDCSTTTEFNCDDGLFEMHLLWTLQTNQEDVDNLTGTLDANMTDLSTGADCAGSFKINARKIRELGEPAPVRPSEH